MRALTKEQFARIRQKANEAIAREERDETPSPRVEALVRKYFRETREFVGLTQSQLASRARISESKLSLFENGQAELTDRELSKIEKVFKPYMEKAPKRFNVPNSLWSRLNEETEADREKWFAEYSKWLWDTIALHKKEDRRFQRKRAGMTQIELARKTGIPTNKLIQWELGRVDLTAEQEKRWVQALEERAAEKQKADPWATIADLLEERKRLLLRIENIGSLDGSIFNEVVESFRREIAQLEGLVSQASDDAEKGD